MPWENQSRAGKPAQNPVNARPLGSGVGPGKIGTTRGTDEKRVAREHRARAEETKGVGRVSRGRQNLETDVPEFNELAVLQSPGFTLAFAGCAHPYFGPVFRAKKMARGIVIGVSVSIERPLQPQAIFGNELPIIRHKLQRR